MVKTLGRFFLLLCSCLLLVYAPEITASVSPPYCVQPPRRVLLRIAVCCEDEQTVSSIYKVINAYQKAQPYIHLRITRTCAQQLSSMRAPYPDIFLIPRELAAQVPTDVSLLDCAMITCAVSNASSEHNTAAGFAVFLYEANLPETTAADF